MSLVIVFDAISLATSLGALFILLIYWKRALQNNLKYLLAGLLVLLIFHSFSNVLQWGGITAALDPFEDYLGILEPLLWGFFLYMFLQETATRKLLESEKKYKTLLENLPQNIFLKDEKSVYISCNENYARYLNIRPDEIVGKTDYDLHPGEQAEKYRVDDERIIKTGKTETIEEKYIVDGQDTWVNSIKMPVKDENDNIVGIQGIFWDITQRKLAEEKLYESYEMFSTIMDSLDAIVYIVDMETYKILFVNKYTQDIFGDIVGKTCWKTILYGQSKPCDFCTNDKLVNADGEPAGVNVWEYYNEKVGCWYSIRARAIWWVDGRIVRLEIAIDITKQKEDELARLQLSNIIESSLNEIYVFDATKFHFTNVNTSALRNLGYTSKEMMSMTPIDIKPEFDEKSFNELVSPLLKNEKDFIEFQTVHRRADGTLYPVFIHLQLIRDPGEPVFLAMILDITERKQMEQLFKESEEKFRLLFEDAPLSYQSMDADGKIISVNKAWLELFRYSEEEVVGRSFADFVSQDDKELFNKRFSEFKAFGEIHGVQYEVVQKDGTHIIVSCEGRVAYDKNGDFKQTHCILSDITDRTKAEAELRSALQKREELEFIINQSQVIAFLWRDAEGWPVEFVSESIKQFGYTPEDFIERHISYADIIHGDDLKRVDNEVALYSKQGVTEFTHEYRIITKSGDIRWVNDITWIRRDQNGTITHFQGVVLDVTERHQAEEEIHKLNKELENRVIDRTIELENKNSELEEMNKLFLGREVRMAELKNRIAKLEEKYGNSDSRT